MNNKLSRKYRIALVSAMAMMVVFALLILLTRLLQSSANAREANSRGELGLDSYRVIQHHALSEIRANLSGVTYSTATDSLFAVTNSPPTIVELDLAGTIKRTIELAGFNDTEGIAHMGQNLFAIVEERFHKVTIAEISTGTTRLNASRSRSFHINTGSSGNRGLEGVGWSPSTGLFVANEKDPKQIFRFPKHLFSNIDQINSINSWKAVPGIVRTSVPIDDISGLHVQQEKKRLLVLSDESHRLVEMDFDGRVYGAFTFNIDPFGFFNQIDQPEGVTMDRNGRIYIVGEPNILIILDKPENPAHFDTSHYS